MKFNFKILCVFLLLGVPLMAHTVLVMPDTALVEINQGAHFRAKLFSDSGERIQVAADDFRWNVRPAELGTISSDGYFIAGNQPGRGLIQVSVKLPGEWVVGEAVVLVGPEEKPPIRLLIRPKKAIVPMGDSLQYRIAAVNTENEPEPIELLRWVVAPKDLGRISPKGLFVAETEGLGKIIVFAKVRGEWIEQSVPVLVNPLPTAVISGKITDKNDGMDIEHAVVEAYRIGKPEWKRKVRTDAAGQYVLNQLLPGNYVIRTTAYGYISEWYDDVRTYAGVLPVTVVENDSIPGIDFLLTHGAAIEGTVLLEQDGTPAAGAHVTVQLAVNPEFKRHALTDENGAYRIEGLMTGIYLAAANAVGYYPELYPETNSVELAEWINVTEPETVSDINFTLETSAAISGQVFADVADTLIQGAIVKAQLLNVSSGQRGQIFETRTNANGQYTLAVQQPGNYLVMSMARGFAKQYYQNTKLMSEASPVVVDTDSHTTAINFRMIELGKLTGLVLGSANGPTEGALVEVFLEGTKNSPENSPTFRTRTDAEGVYLFAALPAGRYFVRVRTEGYLPAFYPGVPVLRDAEMVLLQDAETTIAADLILVKGGIISGSVAALADSLPLTARVSARRLRSNFEVDVVTDEEGRFSLTGLPAGDYVLWAKAAGFVAVFYDGVRQPVDATCLTLAESGLIENIDFFLQTKEEVSGAISGQVLAAPADTLSDPLPLSGARVLAWFIQDGKPQGKPAMAISSEDGSYSFDILKPGRYVVQCGARGYLGEFFDNVRRPREALLIEITAEMDVTDIDFELQPRTEGVYQIAGTVCYDDGAPTELAMVFAESEEGPVSFDLADGSGDFVLAGLVPGDYTIQAVTVDGELVAVEVPMVGVGDGENAESVTIILTKAATGITNELMLPTEFDLSQNYPNPFNPETTISYQLPVSATVSLSIFNLLGQEIRFLMEQSQAAGVHAVKWDGRNNAGLQVPSGLYFYRLTAVGAGGNKFQQIRKMTLMK